MSGMPGNTYAEQRSARGVAVQSLQQRRVNKLSTVPLLEDANIGLRLNCDGLILVY